MEWLRNLIADLKDAIREHKEEINKKRQEDLFVDVNERFYLSEKGGKIYIMKHDTAVYVAKEGEQASQIVEKLNEMRSTAYVYAQLKKK